MTPSLSSLCLLVLVPIAAVSGCVSVKRTHAVAPAAVSGSSGTSAAQEAPRGFIFGEQPVPDGTMNYAVYVPRDYSPQRGPMPCILFLHGSGESGTDGNKQIIQGIGSAVQWNAAEWPCIIILPQKPRQDKQWEEYEPGVMEILSRVNSRWNIDDDRVYLTGLSQGGHGTWTIASMNPGVFAAVAPICGYTRTMSAEQIAKGLGDTPVWAFHGTADDVVPPSETTKVIEALRAERSGRGSDAEVKVSMFEGVNHGAWDRAYRESGLAKWLLSHSRKTK